MGCASVAGDLDVYHRAATGRRSRYPGERETAKTSDITIEILKQIRDGVSTTNQRLEGVERAALETNRRLEGVERAAVETNQRMGVVETTLLELAQQQRFVTRGLRVLGERDHRLEDDLDELRTRVDAIEKRLP